MHHAVQHACYTQAMTESPSHEWNQVENIIYSTHLNMNCERCQTENAKLVVYVSGIDEASASGLGH